MKGAIIYDGNKPVGDTDGIFTIILLLKSSLAMVAGVRQRIEGSSLASKIAGYLQHYWVQT